jgi:hypothetical protein
MKNKDWKESKCIKIKNRTSKKDRDRKEKSEIK